MPNSVPHRGPIVGMDSLDRSEDSEAPAPEAPAAESNSASPAEPTLVSASLGLVALIEKAATTLMTEGLAYIKNAAASLPARRVRRSKFNGAVRQAGETMPFVEEGECHSGDVSPPHRMRLVESSGPLFHSAAAARSRLRQYVWSTSSHPIHALLSR